MLQCPICYMILQFPQECTACENIFCDACIVKWRNQRNRMNNDQCPYRCKEVKSGPHFRKPHKYLLQLLGEITVNCPNRIYGCFESNINLDQVKSHINNDCMYHIIECSGYNMCKQRSFRILIQKHEKSCENAKVMCEYCTCHYPRIEINTHQKHCVMKPDICPYCKEAQFIKMNSQNFKNHKEACMRVEVPCPNNCGQNSILRKDLLSHV